MSRWLALLVVVGLVPFAFGCTAPGDLDARIGSECERYLTGAAKGDPSVVEESGMQAEELRTEVFGTTQTVSIISADNVSVSVKPTESAPNDARIKEFQARFIALVRRADSQVATLTIDAFGQVLNGVPHISLVGLDGRQGGWTDSELP